MDNRDSQDLTLAPDGRPAGEQPRWRRDFPIDAPEDEYVARRDFTKFMVLTSLAFAVGQWWIVVENFFRRKNPRLPLREIARLDDIPIGGFLVFDYPETHQPAVLMRLDESRLIAYDQKCTHLSCPVIPRVDEGRLYCPCHEGSFDITTGRPLAGPPRRPLSRIRVELRDRRIFVAGMERGSV
jgi:nitrite reductase/ring-hydroxylating ferredoxin subunit